MYYVYILISQIDGTLYTGQTHDLRKRLLRLNKGYVRSTRHKVPYDPGYFEIYTTRAEAMWREWELKTKISTGQKKKLVDGFDKNMIKSILSELHQ